MLKERESIERGPSSPCSSMGAPSLGEVSSCAGCGGRIQDRYYLLAVDRQWHACCLKCCECKLPLDSDLTCFAREGNIYCKEDYYKWVTSPDVDKIWHRMIYIWRNLIWKLCMMYLQENQPVVLYGQIRCSSWRIPTTAIKEENSLNILKIVQLIGQWQTFLFRSFFMCVWNATGILIGKNVRPHYFSVT